MWYLWILFPLVLLVILGFVLGGGIYTLAALGALLIGSIFILPLLPWAKSSLEDYTEENKEFDKEHDIT